MTIAHDAQLAMDLARQAGTALLSLQKSGNSKGMKLGAAADLMANRLLVDGIIAKRPNDAILSEEEADNLNRLDHRRVWVIDPLDGTAEYAAGRDDWAVHIGLAIDGGPALGIVALPALGQIHDSSQIALLPPLSPNAPLRMLVSRSRCPEFATTIAAQMHAQVMPMGSAGAKAMAVVRGEAEIYLHSGGQYEWDNCAPVAVAKAAGLHCTRLDGSPLKYNQANPFSPDLLICRPELAAMLHDCLAKIIIKPC
jgi:3'(2'), 5'-bisphosphate nucleotidase